MKRSLSFVASVGILSLLLGLTLTSSAAESVQVTALLPVETTDGRAGACYSFYPDPSTGVGRPFMEPAYNAGSRWDRFDFSWPSLEPSDGSWAFEGHDDLVRDLSEMPMETVGILLWTPEWAAAGGVQALSQSPASPTDWYAPSLMSPQVAEGASPSPPKGLYEEWNDWTTSDGDPVNYWGRFAHTVVSRYSDPARFGQPVKHWEIWNEVDDGAWDYFWTGTKEDYAQLLKVGYKATKDACPDCAVLFAGLLYHADQSYFEDVLDIINDDPSAPANNFYFDVMSVHLYSRSSTIYDTVNLIRSRVRAHVSDHPIWLTETGVPVWDDGRVDPRTDKYDYAARQEEAASYVIQSYANAWASGVERYFFFRTHDEDMTEYFGLVRNDMSLRPAYPALQVATRYLVSPSMVTNWDYSNGVRRVTLWGTPRGKVSVLWNTTPNSVNFDYPAALSTATRVDQRGETHAINASGGAYQIALPGATANLVSSPSDYFIGGEPYLIIEEDTVPPSQASVGPLDATTYDYAIPVSWSATDHEAGIWGFEVQVGHSPSGPWTDWLGIFDTVGASSAEYEEGQHDTQYCFRARAWDGAGNPGEWSETTADQCTRLDLDRDVRLRVDAVFGDENGDGDWDSGNGEPQLHDLSFRLIDPSGSVVASQDSTSSWDVTRTLRIGEYVLLVEPADWPAPPGGWLPRHLSVSVEGGQELQLISHDAVGLYRHRSSSYFPIMARGG